MSAETQTNEHRHFERRTLLPDGIESTGANKKKESALLALTKENDLPPNDLDDASSVL